MKLNKIINKRLLSKQSNTQSETYVYSENIQDEFGMSYFDAVPPNSIAKDLLVIPTTDKGLQKWKRELYFI